MGPVKAYFPTIKKDITAISFGGWPLFTRADLADDVHIDFAGPAPAINKLHFVGANDPLKLFLFERRLHTQPTRLDQVDLAAQTPDQRRDGSLPFRAALSEHDRIALFRQAQGTALDGVASDLVASDFAVPDLTVPDFAPLDDDVFVPSLPGG